MQNIITVMKPVIEKKWKTSSNVFTYQKHRRFDLLQKLAFWYLGRIGAYASYLEETTTYQTIDTHDIIRKAQEQILGMINYGRRPAHIYIGPGDLDKMLADHGAISGKVQMHVGENGFRSILGIPFTIIPGMQGVLVVPQER